MANIINLITKPLFIGFIIASACNAGWLFGIILPTHPRITIPPPPPVSAGSSIIERYDVAFDSAQLANSEHDSAIETAAAIEAIAIGTIVGISLARRFKDGIEG